MAKMSFSVTAELDASLSEEEKYSILDAGAEVLLEAMRRSLQGLTSVRTGALLESLTAKHKKGDQLSVLCGPDDTKRPVTARGLRNRKKRKKARPITNNELGYVLELGTARIPARHWMQQAAEAAEEEIHAAEEAALQRILDEKGL